MNSNQQQYSTLFETFSRLGHPLSEAVKEEIAASTYLETYQKDEVILPYKEVCRNVYFITQGLTMIKFMQGDKERIRWFMMEGDVFISVKGFFHQQASDHCIVALENTQCIAMPKNMLDDIGHRHQEFYELRRALTEHYYVEAEQRIDLLFMTALERCAYMYKHHQELYNRVNNYHMAWRLGMELQTFCNAQKKMLRGGII